MANPFSEAAKGPAAAISPQKSIGSALRDRKEKAIMKPLFRFSPSPEVASW